MMLTTPFTATGCPFGPPPGLLRTWLSHVRENRARARAGDRTHVVAEARTGARRRHTGKTTVSAGV